MINRKEQLILELLQKHGPMFGNEIISKSEKSLGIGSIFTHTSSLEAKGLIQGEKIQISGLAVPRRKFSIKPGGRRALIDAESKAQPDGLKPA